MNQIAVITVKVVADAPMSRHGETEVSPNPAPSASIRSEADAATKALGLGGRALVEPRIDRHGGRLAVLADPSGAPFGVMEWSDTDSKQEPQ